MEPERHVCGGDDGLNLLWRQIFTVPLLVLAAHRLIFLALDIEAPLRQTLGIMLFLDHL